MGKVVQPLGATDPWLAIMPDGSTHLLYNNINGQGRISRERWTFIWNNSTGSYDLTLTDGTIYSFNSYYKYTDYYTRTVWQCTKISKPGVTNSSIQIQYNASTLLLTTITDTYGRTVTFSYRSGTSRLQIRTASTGQ